MRGPRVGDPAPDVTLVATSGRRTFVIDRSGENRYAHRNHDVADNPPNAEVLEALASLRRR